MVKVRLTTIAGAHPVTIPLRLPTTIGRSDAAKIKVRHGRVSRRHCEIFSDGTQLWVRDLGSANGTFINEQRIQEPRFLQTGDCLRVADVVFRVEIQMPSMAVIEFDGGSQSGAGGVSPPEVLAAVSADFPVADSPAADSPSAVLRYHETGEGSFLGIETGSAHAAGVDQVPDIQTGGPERAIVDQEVRIETGAERAARAVASDDSALQRFLKDL